jgi:hypothetical protein
MKGRRALTLTKSTFTGKSAVHFWRSSSPEASIGRLICSASIQPDDALSFSGRPVGPNAWRRRPATKGIRGACCGLVITAGERPKRICGMASPIVKGVLAPILQPIIILTAILTQRFNTSFAPIAIDPSPWEHATNKINTVENIGLRYSGRFDTHPRQRLHAGYATA